MSERERPKLTSTQWLILERLAQGQSDRQIAAALATPPQALRNQLAYIYRVLPLGDAGNPRVVAAVWYARHCGASRPAHRAAHPGLGEAEWRVLERLVRGESNKQIARALSLVDQTIKNHLGSIYRRLPLEDAANRRVAAAIWYDHVGRVQYTDEEGGLPADVARREQIDAERARTPRAADIGPDDGDTGEAWIEEA